MSDVTMDRKSGDDGKRQDILDMITEPITEAEKAEHLKISVDNGGSPVNMIVNLGSIHGDIAQHHVRGSDEEAGSVCLERVKDLGDFIQIHKNTHTVPVMIVIAVLETVPEHLLSSLCQQLERGISRLSGGGGKTEKTDTGYASLKEILALIKAEKIDAQLRREGTAVPIRCVVFTDPSYPEWIRREIWADYFELREAVTGWLMELKDDPAVNVIYYQVVKGISELAVLDCVYAVEKFIDPVDKPWRADRIGYIVKVLGTLRKSTQHKEYVEHLLCTWLKSREPYWRIAYQMYDPSVCTQWYEKLLHDKLSEEIRHDVDALREEENEQHRISKGYLLVPARINLAAAHMLAAVLEEIFSKAGTKPEKGEIVIYFLSLFREDYLYTNPQHRKMLFIDLCNQREERHLLEGILVFAWRDIRYRNVMARIFLQHLGDMKKTADWEYMQWFFKTLGFTGRERDHYNMRYMLERSKAELAGEALDWFNKITKERRRTK